LRHAVLGCLLLAMCLLPALVAGLGIASPTDTSELFRAEQGTAMFAHDAAHAGSRVARLFYGASIVAPPMSPPVDDASRLALVTQARVGQVVGVFGLALLVYLATMLGLGRPRAILAAAAMSLFAPIHGEGHVLRPETPAALFGWLGVLLLLLLPDQYRLGLARPPWRRRLVVTGLCLCGAIATGLSAASLPRAGVHLLIAGGLMTLVAAQLLARMFFAMVRSRWVILPLPAMAARLWPWTLFTLLAMAATWWLLQAGLEVDAERLSGTPSSAGLLAAGPWLRWTSAIVAAIGGLSLLVRVGLRFGRRGRPGADFVLLVACAVLLLQEALRERGGDALLGVAPAAILFAEGCFATVVLVGWAGRRR
jgi:hypothetical protein